MEPRLNKLNKRIIHQQAKLANYTKNCDSLVLDLRRTVYKSEATCAQQCDLSY